MTASLPVSLSTSFPPRRRGKLGCDIHLHIEVKVNGKWEHWGCPNVMRSYMLFEKLAGVRGDVANAIAPPRGLPEDVTSLTRMDREVWNDDGHTSSYITSDEIEHQLYPWYDSLREEPKEQSRFSLDLFPETNFGYFFGNGWDMKNANDHGIEDFRFVFWFDN